MAQRFARADNLRVQHSSSSVTAVVGTLYLMDTTAPNLAVTLPPAASSVHKAVSVKLTTGTNPVTVVSADQIDGQSSIVLDVQYQAVEVASDGVTWHII